MPSRNASSGATADHRPPVALVGAGAVGGALARRLRTAGYPVAAIVSRTPGPARALAAEVGAPVAAQAFEEVPEQVRVIFLCVPDGRVQSVARALADRASLPWARCLAVHTSGALLASALAPLDEAGAMTLSFHPLQAFAPGASGDAFDGIFVGLEGSEDAVSMGRSLAEALGARPFALAASAKKRYHLAASMASNFLVTLLALSSEVMDDALSEQRSPPNANSRGIDAPSGADVLAPLLEGTVRNVLAHATPAAALTGPVARGDAETVATHTAALRAHQPGLTSFYAALATETVRLAERAGHLSPPEAARLLDTLTDALDARGASSG